MQFEQQTLLSRPKSLFTVAMSVKSKPQGQLFERYFLFLPKILFYHRPHLSVRGNPMKQKTRQPGKSKKNPGVSEPLAEYLPDTGPVITVDATGRMVLPKKIRDRFESNRFKVREAEGHIELIPVKPLSSLFGILPDLDIEAIYRDHDREVEEEDADDRSRYPC